MIDDITLRQFWIKQEIKDSKMAHTLESYLVELFKDVKYCAVGLDAGKWITEHYKFNFKCNFYTEKTTNKSTFVTAGDWKATINRLKIESDKINGGR